MQNFLFRTLILASAGISISYPANGNDETINLPETVVTATRSEEPRDELATAPRSLLTMILNNYRSGPCRNC